MAEKFTTVQGSGPVRRLQTQTTMRAPISKVWDAVTREEHVQHWWTKGSIGQRAGDAIVLEGGEAVNGTIVVMMRPYIFEFTWHDTPSESVQPDWLEHNTKSLVRFDLVELSDEATLVTLVQFSPVISQAGAAAGWHHIFERFKEYVEQGVAPVLRPGRFDELKVLYQ